MATDILNYLVPLAQAVVVGTLVAFSILAIGFKVHENLSSISHSVTDISSSVNALEDQIRKVDLKEMEKTIAKLEWQLEDGGGSNNSVEYTLDDSEITVTVSLLPTRERFSPPKAQLTLSAFDDEITSEELEKISEKGIEEITEDELEDILGEVPEDFPEKIVEPPEKTHVKLEFDERINSRFVVNSISGDGN